MAKIKTDDLRAKAKAAFVEAADDWEPDQGACLSEVVQLTYRRD